MKSIKSFTQTRQKENCTDDKLFKIWIKPEKGQNLVLLQKKKVTKKVISKKKLSKNNPKRKSKKKLKRKLKKKKQKDRLKKDEKD